ncbi:hypothetical protein Ocin01_01935 [Orchesella cincta]|uniref:Uncharacterized protein n=1 Tax=Orchesella cincta TaxID=48709 RepID=A0A1D2NHK2_ORCCI|nr:hypothetical protein Ocin01_01935 [Orchesella cincta]
MLLFLLLLLAQNSHSRVIDCVDDPTSFSKSLWKFNIQRKVASFNGTAVIGVEGTDSKVAKDVYATATFPPGATKNVFLYLEYLNESPRRISIQPSKTSGIDLLPGTLADWTDTVQQVALQSNNEIKLTMLLKTGQSVYFRKMVLYHSRTLMTFHAPTFVSTTTRPARRPGRLVQAPVNQQLAAVQRVTLESNPAQFVQSVLVFAIATATKSADADGRKKEIKNNQFRSQIKIRTFCLFA